MKLFQKWFTKENKSLKVDQLYPGDTIHIKFLDPKKLGYVNSTDITFKFHPEDLKTNSTTGQVILIKRDNVMHLFILEMFSVKKDGTVRRYLFVENEITNIELLRRD